MEEWLGLGNAYTCRAAVFALEDEFYLHEVGFDHLEGKSKYDVEVFDVQNQTFRYIPKNLDEFFPNLKCINWYNSDLTSISSDDLKPFPDLVRLGVWLNNLESLDGDLFKYTPKLKIIDFEENHIRHVGHGLLSGLHELEEIYFWNNICIDDDAFDSESVRQLEQELMEKCPPLKSDNNNEVIEDADNEVSEVHDIEETSEEFQASNDDSSSKIYDIDEASNDNQRSETPEIDCDTFCADRVELLRLNIKELLELILKLSSETSELKVEITEQSSAISHLVSHFLHHKRVKGEDEFLKHRNDSK